MARIVRKATLAPLIHRLHVEAPEIARRRKAGQFIMLRTHEEGERIPLTIADSDPADGTITLIFQEMGYSTRYLATLAEGDEILDLVGPLGTPTHIERFGRCLGVGGGVGVAPLYPIAKALTEAGNEVIAVIGARSRDLVILEREFRDLVPDTQICTDDGSCGFHGFVTQKAKAILDGQEVRSAARDRRSWRAADGPLPIHLIVGIGPVPMMKALVETVRPYGIPVVVSLNPLMIDGTGMCGGCRVEVGGETRFTCVDGPEFDGLKVNFDLLSQRLRAYLPQEKDALATRLTSEVSHERG